MTQTLRSRSFPRIQPLLISIAALVASPAALAQLAAPTDPALQRLPTRYTGQADGTWKGNLGLGVTLTRGNSESEQLSLSFDAARATSDDRIVFRGIAVRNETNQGTQADNAQASARYERNVSTDWFGFGQAEFERDVLRDLNLRQTYGTGVGYRFVQTERTQFNVYTGLAYTRLNNVASADTEGVEAFVGNEWSVKLGDNASFIERFVYYPDTADTGGGRYVLEATINTKIQGALGLQLTALQKYQQVVPPGRKSTDTILFTVVTVAF
ncbi:MAG TPA: DUF481 domain-containing protein [Burkholderiaceae bacterium]|nr:DUF481 domain-containing protein [Burkholderiaceae bacterium]